MRVFRLEPIDLTHNDWRSSTHKGPTRIRAASVGEARWVATLAFRIATLVERGQSIPMNPWINSHRTIATVDGDDDGLIEDPSVIDPQGIDQSEIPESNWQKLRDQGFFDQYDQ